MKLLITGGAGFIGSNFIYYMREQHPDYTLINVDKLTYAGNLENLKKLEGDPNYRFVRGDITDIQAMEPLFQEGLDGVIHFAAESHVDRSIDQADVFIVTNILGTQILLNLARKYQVPRYLQVSTDEVYGSLGPTGYFTEETPLAPNSPYSASKAGADLLVRSAYHTFKLPVLITRCSNNYGPYQFPEKLIPLMISNALEGKELPVYGDGLNVRDWLHVKDHCAGIDLVFHQGTPGEVYNIGGNNERSNIEIVKLILKELNQPESLIKYVKDRPGHDRRYAIDATKIRKALGWEPSIRFEDGLKETIKWYLDHRSWWENIKSGDYQSYYEKMYGGR
ncbi:MAG: dTDP-glucose 4,6-dehydratase [Firmicutes bacterium]|nr:dTDP-glucose 4,6-dehydratase [Bacillota bacterium]